METKYTFNGIKNSDAESAVGLLAVVVSVGADFYLVKPKGRRMNASLQGHKVWDAFAVHELKFGDLIVCDVERGATGKDVVTACRACSEEEYERR
jgi:hypothetical protein